MSAENGRTPWEAAAYWEGHREGGRAAWRSQQACADGEAARAAIKQTLKALIRVANQSNGAYVTVTQLEWFSGPDGIERMFAAAEVK